MKKIRRFLKEHFIVIIVFLIMMTFLVNVLLQTNPFTRYYTFNFDLDSKTNVPAYLTFFITAITAIFLYRTLASQNKTLEEQRRANQISEFENRFFKFIDYHRDNVNGLKYRNPKDPKLHYFEGNQVFTVIYYEIKDLLAQYSKKKCYGLRVLSIDEKRKAIDFVYHCIFYGAGKHAGEIMNRFSEEFYYVDFKERKASYCDENGEQETYYSGHVRRLGHYFRNLYRAVNYVDRQVFLTPKQKYEYVSTLRAQMSVYEQAVFFYNSLSGLGKAWEMQIYEQAKFNFAKKEQIFNRFLLTKYDLVRNTFNNDGVISEGINIKEFYPLLNLEREEELCKSGKIKFFKAFG